MDNVTPWWRDVELRQEIIESSGEIGDVQMSLHSVAEGTVGAQPPYAEAGYYGEITHPSGDLTALMGTVAARLAGGEHTRGLDALVRLDQGMGGGKSHGLIGLWHLARDPGSMRATDVGRVALEEAEKRARQALPEDLGNPQTVVLACDNMTADQPVPEVDGPARNLYERFLWRLVGGDRAMFDRYREHHANKAKITEALYAINRPVLILVDEVLNYIEQLSHSDNADLAVEDMAFLRALCDAVNEVPGVVMVVVMIASEDDRVALDEAGERRREDLEGLLTRNGTTATVTSGGDFSDILRRRLFKRTGTPEVVAATAQEYLRSMQGQWREKVFDQLPRCGEHEFEAHVKRSYPFHPLLMDMAEDEWSRIAGFQRVRSTIRIFAATVYAHQQRASAGGWAPLLIGPGDLPLADTTVRESVIGSGLIASRKAEANFRSLVEGDVVGSDDRSGTARIIDLAEPGRENNPRAAERAATALFMHSIVGGRKQGQPGATVPELLASTFVPDATFTPTDAEMVLASLEDQDAGLASREERPGRGGRQPRWVMTTRNTLEMHYKQARTSVTDGEREQRLARIANEWTRTGPFHDKSFVDAPEGSDPVQVISDAGIDDARSNRLVVLDPRTYTFLNGVDEATRRALDSAFGAGALTVRWASSVVFAVANTQRRSLARRAVTELLAWERVCELDEVRGDNESLQQARQRLDGVKDGAAKMVKSAYQHIVYLDEGDNGRERRELRLDPTKESALDGTIVWKHLVEQGKALDTGEFDADALIHNLRDGDYGRPLDELRDLFWSTPRMPLLPEGDADLQRAIFEAVARGDLRLVGADDRERAVRSAHDIGVGQSGLRLLRPDDQTDEGGATGAGEGEQPPIDAGYGSSGESSGSDVAVGSTGGESTNEGTVASREVQLTLSLNASMRDPELRNHVWEALNSLAESIDDGHTSHAQLQIRAVLDQTTAETIAGNIKEAGGQAQSHKL